MRTGVLIVALTLLSTVLSACKTHTKVGGGAYFPEASDHTSYEFSLSIGVHGAPGHAYVDRTDKLINLSIVDRAGRLLLQRSYTVTAGNLEWSVQWPDRGTVRLVFFEYMIGESEGAGDSGNHLPRQILAQSYVLSAEGTRYVDPRVPKWVSDGLSKSINREATRQIVVITYRNDEQTINKVLRDASMVAKSHGLEQHKVPSNLIGRLAFYSGDEISLDVHEFESSGKLQLTIDYWGKSNLFDTIENKLKTDAVLATERIVSIYVPVDAHRRSKILERIQEALQDEGMDREKSCPPAFAGCYSLPGIELKISELDSPQRFKIYIKETDTRQEGLRLESSLRQLLSVI